MLLSSLSDVGVTSPLSIQEASFSLHIVAAYLSHSVTPCAHPVVDPWAVLREVLSIVRFPQESFLFSSFPINWWSLSVPELRVSLSLMWQNLSFIYISLSLYLYYCELPEDKTPWTGRTQIAYFFFFLFSCSWAPSAWDPILQFMGKMSSCGTYFSVDFIHNLPQLKVIFKNKL